MRRKGYRSKSKGDIKPPAINLSEWFKYAMRKEQKGRLVADFIELEVPVEHSIISCQLNHYLKL